ncbi:MAG: hypothetical protein ACLPR9_07865 [Acidimicrobiales bacterium]
MATPNADSAVQVTEYVAHHGFEATIGARDMPTRASRSQRATTAHRIER